MLYWLRDHKLTSKLNQPPQIDQQLLADLCASFQAAVVDVLAHKIVAAVRQYHIRDVAIAGGVSANSELQKRLTGLQTKEHFRLFLPQMEYCTDNGAMIAMVGWMKLLRGITSTVELNAVANLSL